MVVILIHDGRVVKIGMLKKIVAPLSPGIEHQLFCASRSAPWSRFD